MASADGRHFEYYQTALTADPGIGEACIYDAGITRVSENGRQEIYLEYSGAEAPRQGHLKLAKSTTGTLHGTWQRVGTTISREEVPFHNQIGQEGYEWGLEGPRSIQLPNERILKMAVSFLPVGLPGTRQRLFLAEADRMQGPYEILGMLMGGPGENGHGGVILSGDDLKIPFQWRLDSHWYAYMGTIPWRALSAPEL